MTDVVLRNVYTFLSGVRDQVPEALWLLTLFAAAVLQVLVPPVPGDAVLCATAILCAPLFEVQYLLCYFLGSFLACVALYELGRAKGATLLNQPWLARQRGIKRARIYLRRRGHWALLATKFIPGVNSVAVALCGASRSPRAASYGAMAAACAAHNSALFLLGLLLGENWWTLQQALHGVSALGLALVLLGIAAVLLLHGYLRRREGDTHE